MLALAWLTSLALAAALGCSKPTSSGPPASSSSSAAAAEPSVPTAAEDPRPGVGTVEGTVLFVGKPPPQLDIPRQADPICAAKPMKSNEVVVGPGGALKDVLVRIAPGAVKGKFTPPAEPVLVHQQDCMYVPRVQGAVAGQVVQIENMDKTMHNVHTYRGQETVLNQGQPAGAPPLKKDNITTEPATFKLKCDVHPWMTGYLVVTDHPFFQTTGDDGSFRLVGVPAGRYTVEAWHAKYGLKTATITVAADQVAPIKFNYDGTEKGD